MVSVHDDRVNSRLFLYKIEAIIQMHLVYHTLDFRSLVSNTNERQSYQDLSGVSLNVKSKPRHQIWSS